MIAANAIVEKEVVNVAVNVEVAVVIYEKVDFVKFMVKETENELIMVIVLVVVNFEDVVGRIKVTVFVEFNFKTKKIASNANNK